MVISANIAAMVNDRVAALGRELQDDDLEPVTHSMAALPNCTDGRNGAGRPRLQRGHSFRDLDGQADTTSA